MNDAQMSVLRMISEGKISAEEGDRLLQALEQAEGQPRQRTWPIRNPWTEAEDDEFVRAFEHSPDAWPIAEETMLDVLNAHGPVRLYSVEGDSLQVDGLLPHQYRITTEGNRVLLRTGRIGAPLSLGVPSTVSRIRAVAHVGEIEADGLNCERITLDTRIGNVRLDTGGVPLRSGQEVRLRSHVGDIQLCLSARSACTIRAKTGHLGNTLSELDIEVIKEAAGLLHGHLNGGGADVRAIITRIGNIRIMSRDTDQDIDTDVPDPWAEQDTGGAEHE